ncbi:MAG: flagellar basal body-associated FliL family protein [Oscillospiraceae bacterium]|nr:flagellar basal body-associated FliL family protein [Oscillospiraceae bacterium]
MEGKSNVFSIVLLVIIAILALALCIAVGALFLGGGPAEETEAVDEVPRSPQPGSNLPKDSDLASFVLYSQASPGLFNLKAGTTTHVIQVFMNVKYFIKITDLNPEEKIETYLSDIKQLVGSYFQNMSYQDALLPETKEKAREELKDAINELLCRNELYRIDMIYDIVFERWFCQ